MLNCRNTLSKITPAELLELLISEFTKYTLNITTMYCIKIGNKLVAKDFKTHPEAQAWKNYHCPKGKVTKQ